MASFRVAVIGAGPSGLMFASLLSRKPPVRLSVSVFERDSREQALRRAEVELARVAHESSNTSRVCRVGKPEPLLMLPFLKTRASESAHSKADQRAIYGHVLQNLKGAMDGRKITWNFDRAPADLRLVETTGQAELLDRTGTLMGRYDLVVDAGGVAGPLRRCRVDEPPGIRQHYTGISMLYGVIPDLESVCSPTLMRQMGQDTLWLLGPLRDGKGAGVFLERFATTAEDRRAAFGLLLHRERPGDLADELNQAHSGELTDELHRSVSMITDTEPHELSRLQCWIKEQLSDEWRDLHKVVDSSEWLSVQPMFSFPSDPMLRDNKLPVICIGDALHAVPLYVEESGELAFADASALADAVRQFLSQANPNRSQLLLLLRSQEESMIKRANEFVIGLKETGLRINELVLHSLRTPHFMENVSTSKLFRGAGWTVWSVVTAVIYPLIFRSLRSLHDRFERNSSPSRDR
mmetsp:Transcript_16429/g.49297  ORF Transcript_16429/g.49297 Transcript_16429/m.49297 type:complete len:465 (-) Transcript_16429:61-1455(-)